MPRKKRRALVWVASSDYAPGFAGERRPTQAVHGSPGFRTSLVVRERDEYDEPGWAI